MPTHQQTLSRLDLLVAEAHRLCTEAEHTYLDKTRPDAGIPFAFQTVLRRRTRDWMERAESMVRTVKPGADRLCGQRAIELRRLIDTANVAMLKPSEGREGWHAFYRATRDTRHASC